MRIIYIGSFRLPNKDAAAARVLNVARALRIGGHEVSFISWGGVERDCDLCPDGKYRIDDFVYEVTHELDPKGGLYQRMKSKLTRGNKTKRILQERLGQYDVIITYNGNIAGWLVRFTRKYNVKLISDLTEWYDNNELKVSDWLPYAHNMKCTQQHVKNKIVISYFFDDYYKSTHNIVVPATCDGGEAKWHTGVDVVKKKIGEFDGLTLIYAGNPVRKDAVHYVINAVQRLIDDGAKLRFLILGAERKLYIKNYADMLTKKELSERIIFLGRVPQDEVPSYYTLADFMVLIREQTRKSNAGFPTKFAESFTCGTPVIANITSDIGRYLKDGETGFVVSDPKEDAVQSVLKEKVLRMNRHEIDVMKSKVKKISARLDYHAYVEPLQIFMEKLK